MAEGNHRWVVGIDLGTTYSSVAYLDGRGKVHSVPNEEGKLLTPSVLFFDSEDRIVVGEEARRIAVAKPDQVAECVKRDMGSRFYHRPVAGRRLRPEVLSSMILRKLRQDAERVLGPIGGAVVTVPAYFDDTRRRATEDAGRIAGLEVVDIVNEPTAAALAYAYEDVLSADPAFDFSDVPDAVSDETLLVYDLGGGTFDVSVLRVRGREFQVLATEGEVLLGGRDWDERLVDLVAEKYIERYGSDPRENLSALQELYAQCEAAKRELSEDERVFLEFGAEEGALEVELTRAKFEEITTDLLGRTEIAVQRALTAAGVALEQVDEVLLTGGATRMPQVHRMLAGVVGRTPSDRLTPDLVVGRGAAIHAAMLHAHGGRRPEEGSGAEMDTASRTARQRDALPVLPLAKDVDGARGAGRQRDALPVLPLAKDVDGAREAGQEGEESPARAAKAAGADARHVYDAHALEVLESIKHKGVNAHSMGVIAKDPANGRAINSIMIPKNTPVPCETSRTFGLESDNQPVVKIRIVEGESPDPEACVEIGRCVISSLPKGLKRRSPVQVTFQYDSSARIHVRAVEMSSGRRARTHIERTTNPDGQDVASAAADAARVRVT